jgi:RNA polymerase sigma factor for flagellar operon FliA
LANHHENQPLDCLDRLISLRFNSSLTAAIQNLPEREKYFMSLFYERDLNLKEIAEIMGVTESRASQLHSQAVVRLRHSLKEIL